MKRPKKKPVQEPRPIPPRVQNAIDSVTVKDLETAIKKGKSK